MRVNRRIRPAAAMAAALTLLSACRDPEVPVPTPPSSSQAEESFGPTSSDVPAPGAAVDVPDPRDAELVALGRDLERTLVALATDFEGLRQAASIDEAAPVTARLLATLSADPRWSDPDGDGTPDELEVRPLLPGPDSSREETVDYGDAFSAVLAAGRDAGATGAEFVDVLREPMMGDLGAWQRDPGGLLDAIVAQVRDVRDVPSGERAVGELQGEAPRALAYALLADAAVARRDLDLVHAYGERGAVHVGLVLEAVRPLIDGSDAPA